MSAANAVTLPLAGYKARHIRLAVDGKVATLTLDRPDKKNPLTFDSYAEIADLFRATAKEKAVRAFVVTGTGGNFCSGGDVFEIIKPLVEMEARELLDFTRMTGEVVKAMRACPQPIIAAVDGVCAGAGAILAMACDVRLGTPGAKVAFLFNRVGLAGCDMGACAILPRIIGAGRAATRGRRSRSPARDPSAGSSAPWTSARASTRRTPRSPPSPARAGGGLASAGSRERPPGTAGCTG